MSRKRNGRGRPNRGRPHEALAPAEQDLPSHGPQGAEPSCREAASRGPSPPADAGEKGQSNGQDVDPGKPQVNGSAARSPRLPRYSWGKGGIIWHRETARSGDEEIPLTNFAARIISDITRDDGVEQTRHYEIAATLGDTPYRFTVPAHQFKSLGWVAEHLGASAIVEPGQGMQARIPHAIQVLSGDIPRSYVYCHTGWCRVDGCDYFLHSGGALGVNGHRSDIEVDLPKDLARVELIEPESEEELKAAVRKSLMLCHLTPMRVSAPVLGGVYRAPLGGSNVTVAPWGKTGKGKTAFAAICQQHVGPGMDADHLPLNWENTANHLEAVSSAGKDIPLVIDEFVPSANSIERAKLQAKGERYIRSVGNASGRGRMRSDLTLRPGRPPRCQPISTGEEVPTGQSLRARMVAVEVRDGDMQWAQLTLAQAEARSGTYATAMAGYVMWMAQDLAEARRLFEANRLAVREIVQAQHKRVADAIAQLAAAWAMYLFFATAIGAIDEPMAERVKADVWAGLMEVAAEQEELQRASEPVGRFRDLIIAALSTGRAHVVSNSSGKHPMPDPERWGWRRDDFGWSARGEHIGWLTDDGTLFLEPDVSYQVASKVGSIGIAAETLGQRLAEARVTVIEREGSRIRYRPKRKVYGGGRPRIFHIRTTDWLYPPTDSGAIGASGAETKETQLEHGVSDALH